MIYSINSGVPQVFPSQKKTDAQKTDSWMKNCVDAGVELVNWENNSDLRKSKKEMVTLYNLVNGIIDPSDKKKITNPLNLQGYDFPGTAQTYPLITPLLSVLTGEERNRVHNFSVSVVNHDAVSEKQEKLRQQLDAFLIGEVQNSQKSEEEIQKELEKLGNWANYTYRDIRERMGYQLLSYLRQHLDLDFQFNTGFENLLTVGEQIYVADIVGGEPIIRKGNPLNFTFVRSSDSPYPEESDMIIEDGYLNVGQVIDEYYDVLKEKDIKRLEQGSTANKNLKSSLFTHQNLSPEFSVDDLIANSGDDDSILSTPNIFGTYSLSSGFDENGRIRRTRVLWKSMRKIGIVKFTDENGDLVRALVPEQYEPDKERGEEVNWHWISEWWEGTKLANDIYVKMQPRPIQFREMTNLSKCHPGIVGIINNVNSSKVTSFVSALKPLQYLYDEFTYRMQTLFMTSYGTIATLDISQVPDGWDMDKWLYYAITHKWAVKDPMKEGAEGAARGKLAGNMNQGPNTYDLSQGNLIQQNLYMMEYIEDRANEVAGITPQRKGSISNRETVGGAERAVVQSSHRTEKWFSLHDHVKLRVYKVLIETAKAAWKEQSFKRKFFMDDMTEALLEFDGQTFNEAEYGIMVNNATQDTKLKNLLESSMQVLLQNNVSVSSIIDIYRTGDLSTMQRKIEQKEQEIAQREAEQNEAALKQRDREAQLKAQSEQAERDLKDKMNIRDNQTKLITSNPENLDEEKLELDIKEHNDKMEKEKRKLDLEKEKLNETVRHNKVTEKKQNVKK